MMTNQLSCIAPDGLCGTILNGANRLLGKFSIIVDLIQLMPNGFIEFIFRTPINKVVLVGSARLNDGS